LRSGGPARTVDVGSTHLAKENVMSTKLEVLRVMDRFRWSKPFATEYVMARRYHGLGHESAIREAKRSPYVSPRDVPAGV
jgi:hypothetical protein